MTRLTGKAQQKIKKTYTIRVYEHVYISLTYQGVKI